MTGRKRQALFLFFGIAACGTDPVHPEASPGTSTISANAASLYADGVSTAAITVTLRDRSDELIGQSAGVVTMATTSGTLSSVRDNLDGTYGSTLRSPSEVGVASLTAFLNGTQLATTLHLPVVAGPPTTGQWIAAVTWLYADGQSSVPITFIVQDARQRPVTLPPGAVTMTATKGTLSAVDDVDGAHAARITSTTTDEVAVVTARVMGEPFGPPLTLRFDHRHWVPGAPMAAPRFNLAGAVVDGVFYATGGRATWLPNSWVSDLEAYDPVADRWTTLAPMPTARTDLAVAAVGGVLYAIGGSNAANLAVVEAYDRATNTWSTRAAMLTARAGLGVGVVDGVLYAVGGRTFSPSAVSPAGTMLNDLPHTGATGVVEAYHPETDTWVTLPPMPTARAHFGIGVINGILYAVGGNVGTVEAFDPATNQWSSRAPLPTPRTTLGVAVVDGKLYALGGFRGYIETTIVEVYDPLTNTWTDAPPMREIRQAMAVGAMNGRLYTVGGACYDRVVPDVEILAR